jgi:CRP-like cAMP-binding protein
MRSSLLTALHPFGPLPTADHARFLDAWQARFVAEGEVLCAPGTVCQQLFFIEQGVLCLRERPPRGKAVVHSFRSEGHFCTLLTSFEQQTPTPVGIYAACPTQVLVIDKAQWTTLEHALPSLAPIFTRLLRHTLFEKLSLQRSYLGQDAATRYETFLATQPTIARRVPQHLIAAYLGITPQSLSRLSQGSY